MIDRDPFGRMFGTMLMTMMMTRNRNTSAARVGCDLLSIIIICRPLGRR
ncbi:MAG: hypothetical protein R3E58_11700 [Phycisphaerae bacterium]